MPFFIRGGAQTTPTVRTQSSRADDPDNSHATMLAISPLLLAFNAPTLHMTSSTARARAASMGVRTPAAVRA